MSDPFTVLMRVRYAECDAQGVVFNSRYADYVDILLTEFMRHQFGGFKTLIENGIDNQVVHLALDWQSSASFDDVLALSLTPTRVGNTSFGFHIQMWDHPSGRDVATAEIVYVLVDTEKYEKMPIPDDMREKLESGAPGIKVDFSGIA